MIWLNRLRTSIEMTSPMGKVFNPKWRGNDRSREKKLGIFTYPDSAGSIVQDLNVNSIKYPLTVYFDGSDHDLDSEKFFEATAETGTWSIIHPVKGSLVLQLVSVTEPIQPIDSGNLTVFTLEFIEPADQSVIKSKLELRSFAAANISAADAFRLQQLADAISGVAGKGRTAVNNATNKVKDIINSVLNPLAQIEDSINASFNAIDRAITDTIEAVILAPEELGGQLTNLVKLPAKISISATQKLSNYKNLITQLLTVDGDSKETFSIKDLVLGAAISAVADIAITTDALTRSESIEQISTVSELFNSITDTLDTDQDLVDTDKIEDQYISQEGSYPYNLLIIGLSIDYLLKFSFNLSVEKRFTLKEYRLPIMIVIDEYGSDEFLDFFNATNNLSRSEFMILPPDREIVVYPGTVLAS